MGESYIKHPVYWAGIGSRKAPNDKLEEMTRISMWMSLRQDAPYILRTGNADGADFAFMKGSINMEIYNPWRAYNQKNLDLLDPNAVHIDLYPNPTKEAIELASKYHPAWKYCSQGAQKLHARNAHIILGYDLKTPVKFVVCWHNDKGGTLQGVRIAEAHKIPVYNLRDMTVEQVMEAINEHNQGK